MLGIVRTQRELIRTWKESLPQSLILEGRREGCMWSQRWMELRGVV